MLKQVIKRKNRKAVSEIISYVILIAITIGVSVGVYAWLKYQIPTCRDGDIDCFSPVDCPDGTSIMIRDYKCNVSGMNMILANNGRFNVTGIIMVVSEDDSKIPSEYLTPIGSKASRYGEFIFKTPLKPNDEVSIQFSATTKDKSAVTKIEQIKMQIFVNETSRKMCKNVVLKENIKNCLMS